MVYYKGVLGKRCKYTCHWNTPSTIKTDVRIQHVLAANLNFQKLSLSIKITNTCNFRDTTEKGATKLPDRLHKGLLYEIILIGELYVLPPRGIRRLKK